jgi:hypothetical protein
MGIAEPFYDKLFPLLVDVQNKGSAVDDMSFMSWSSIHSWRLHHLTTIRFRGRQIAKTGAFIILHLRRNRAPKLTGFILN